MGVKSHRRSQSNNIFFNQFITDVYNEKGKDMATVTDEELCKELMTRVAIVNIEITSPDAIVIERHIRGGLLGLVTQTGGLLSLYAGFSFLSLGELVFWIARLVYMFDVCNKRPKDV